MSDQAPSLDTKSLSGLVAEKLHEQMDATRKARDEASRASTLDGFLSAVLVTAGVALGLAASMNLLPMVAMTAIGAGVAGTFGVLLGVAAVNNRDDARKLDVELAQLHAIEKDAKDGTLVNIVQESLCSSPAADASVAQGQAWTQKVAEAGHECGCGKAI